MSLVSPLVTVFVATTRERARAAARAATAAAVTVETAPIDWPFLQPVVSALPTGDVVIHADDLDCAFVNAQKGGTRLVTTQALYLGEEWLAALGRHGAARLVASAARAALDAHAPEVRRRRGAWAAADIVEVDDEATSPEARVADASRVRSDGASAPSAVATAWPAIFRLDDSAERLRRAVAALEHGRSAPALLATASVCMEVNDLAAAARDLDEAAALAPEWAAVHFERGKLALRQDDMETAAAAFERATRQLPGFGPAWSNLGATLGELDRPDAALAAFERALAIDPANPQAVNNVGVVRRELGRLAESEQAFRQVISLAPELAVGHYNLGHTLFLQGRYQAALSAYAEGQRRDPGRNPVQASRLAVCRLATGDGTTALRDLQQAVAAVAPGARTQLLADTSAIVWALVTQQPGLSGWQPMQEWIRGELARVSGGRA